MPPFDELAEPGLLAELAALAEDRGWDGFFVWDHVDYRAPVRAVADPWVALAAVAAAHFADSPRAAGDAVVAAAGAQARPRDRHPRSAQRRPADPRGRPGRRQQRRAQRPRRGDRSARPGELLDAGSRSSPVTGTEGSSRGRRNARGSRSGWPAGGRSAGARCGARRAGTASFRSSCPARRRSPSWRPRSRSCGEGDGPVRPRGRDRAGRGSAALGRSRRDLGADQLRDRAPRTRCAPLSTRGPNRDLRPVSSPWSK